MFGALIGRRCCVGRGRAPSTSIATNKIGLFLTPVINAVGSRCRLGRGMSVGTVGVIPWCGRLRYSSRSVAGVQPCMTCPWAAPRPRSMQTLWVCRQPRFCILKTSDAVAMWPAPRPDKNIDELLERICGIDVIVAYRFCGQLRCVQCFLCVHSPSMPRYMQVLADISMGDMRGISLVGFGLSLSRSVWCFPSVAWRTSGVAIPRSHPLRVRDGGRRQVMHRNRRPPPHNCLQMFGVGRWQVARASTDLWAKWTRWQDIHSRQCSDPRSLASRSVGTSWHLGGSLFL